MKDTLYEALIKDVHRYLKMPENINLITKAYEFAKEVHTGQLRKSGEPFITHPVAVARILSDLSAGPATIVAALLHDVVEDTDISLDDIKEKFGDDVAELVEGVTKISKLKFSPTAMTDNQQKMLLAMAQDIRVVFIKVADRLHNMRTLDGMPPDKRVPIAQETLDIYAPIAHRLGLFTIKAELEDLAIRYVDPNMYFKITNDIKSNKDELAKKSEKIIANITNLLHENGFKDFEIKGRVKNIYSIYKKITNEGRSFQDIYDLQAIRVIIDSEDACWRVLGIIQGHFNAIPGRFKDYISRPKPNLYQSIHTTVHYLDGTIFEVQIRTPQMDDVAEKGVAAHWAYKESATYSKEKEQFEIAEKLRWYKDLLTISKDEEVVGDSAQYVETVKQDILTSNVYVYTPKNEIYELASGSTPIDFAYRIHSDIGDKMVGATVNGKIVPIDYVLSTGDVVSIKTNKNSSGPSADWLKIVRSSRAKHKIRNFLNKANRENLVESGKLSLERELNQVKGGVIINDAFVKTHFEKQDLENLEDLYLEIGKGIISTKTVLNKILGLSIDKDELLARQMDKASKQLIAHSDTGVVIEGLPNPKIKLASCCMPIKGDDIIGYVSKTSGLVVHRANCPNVADYDENRFLPAFWGTNVTRKYPAWLKLKGANRPNLVADVVLAVNAQGIAIAEMSAVVNSQLQSIIKLKVSVNSNVELNNCMTNLAKVAGIYEIERDIQ